MGPYRTPCNNSKKKKKLKTETQAPTKKIHAPPGYRRRGRGAVDAPRVSRMRWRGQPAAQGHAPSRLCHPLSACSPLPLAPACYPHLPRTATAVRLRCRPQRIGPVPTSAGPAGPMPLPIGPRRPSWSTGAARARPRGADHAGHSQPPGRVSGGTVTEYTSTCAEGVGARTGTRRRVKTCR